MALGAGINPHGTKRSVLVVEDNEINREMLCAILNDDFDVIEAEDGLVGLEQLAKHYEDLSLILLDVYMPRCDGFEFLRRKREDERFDPVPVIVTTVSNRREDEIECLRLGANDFVVKPYNVEIMVNRINNIIHLRESASIVNQLTWDSLTNLYSREFFYRRVDSVLAANTDMTYDMVCSDIANFKSLNDRYGKTNCDMMLHVIADRLILSLPDYIAGGRIGSDTFAFLIGHQDDHEWASLLKDISNGLIAGNISIKFGIVENVDPHLAVSLTCDRAIIALEQIKGTFGATVAWYNDELRRQQQREQIIVETMENALEQHQFTVYYQPKHNVDTNATGGAEALVRWIHPELGLIHPEQFVPLFERNGFVTMLDLYVFEEVCKEIKRCKALGLPALPISANISRLDFDMPDLATQLAAIADKYGIDHRLLHIEVTETAYSEDPDNVSQTLRTLREEGFVVELDDFGSGYSSLASLNTLPLDVVKLDMSIIQQAATLNDYRIVHSAIQMAAFLDLKTVAEGVETEDEANELKKLGCHMIQGFFYSRPLARNDYERYISQEEDT